MESHAEITNKEGSPEATTSDPPRIKPRKPRARSEIVTSTTNESRKDDVKPKKEKKEKREKKVKKDNLDTESKKPKKEKKDKKSKKETTESNTTTDNEADSFSAIVLPPSYQWPSRKIQSLPYNQTGIKERPSLKDLDPMFLASPKLESKEWVESLLVNKAVPSVVTSPDAKKTEFSDSTLQRAATAKAYFEEKYKKIATTLNTGNVYNPIEEKRKQIANQRLVRNVNRYSADDARIRKARDEAIKLKTEEDVKMEKLRLEEEAERKFQEEQREKQLKLMQEENEITPEAGTSPDGPSGKPKFLSIFDTNPIDKLGQKLSSLEASRLGQKLSSIDGSKIHQKLKGMKNQVFKTNKKRENEIVISTASTPPSHDAINMNVVDALLQDLEGNDSLITSEERDLLDALANATMTRPHSSSISQSTKIQVSSPVVMQDVQSASAENIRAAIEPKVPATQSLPTIAKVIDDMNDPEIDKEIDRIEEKIAERERLLQEIHNKFPQFEEIHLFAEEMTSNLAEAKKELAETVASVRKMDNDLIANKNKIDISLSTIQRCSDKIQRLEEGIQDCQRIKGNIMFAYISSILSVYFLGAFSILAKIAYYPYHEVSKRLAPTKKTTKPKDSSVDSNSMDSVPTSPEASVTLQKKKGLLNRKDNWESLQTKMLDVQRLREEEKKKQNL